ncbi:polysaccharide ABC transporter ATP-binding protein [Flavihumibacter sp. ZG627]|uniref:ABC transporter ATP-binding protein n=1 Tax=Flavihumibacter sp. ZG627 TaxID=1463156 RepID=UPI00069467A1|nr:polysaccharide ABC transporter ATP-binding protein [Flavihumibacter sp. ZG627]
MSREMIMVENLSKLYKLGEINTGSLSHDLQRVLVRLSGKEDPYRKLAEVNDRKAMPANGYVWSLKDVGFSVNEGEVFGIIGKNGAGKSTLLKLMSKITKPTTGTINVDGRVASLLEVGTGFHPDLSGRENIFLNGAILGMRKQEIKLRFDEIVEFSGIEKYLDTPVKRYSSGMFVRLAFAVAAHLEPEILIIDEVLAVGDAEFQKKCIAKMGDIARQDGRTILFVSHNVSAVKQLCNKAMLLENGMVKALGDVNEVLETYQGNNQDTESGIRSSIPENLPGHFTRWWLSGQSAKGEHTCYTREHFRLNISFQCFEKIRNAEMQFMLRYDDDQVLLHSSSSDFAGQIFDLEPGTHTLSFELALPIRRGHYELETGLWANNRWIDRWISSTKLVVLDTYEGHSRDHSNGILNIRTAFVKKAFQPNAILYEY